MYKGNLDQSMVSDSTGGSGNKPLPQEVIKEANYSKADERGNPCVNLATGRLKYVLDGIAVGRGNFNIAVSHIYSSKGYGAFANKIKGLGNNWKLNLTQIVVPDNYDQNNAKVYKYLDGAGEVHRFVQFDTNRYYDDRNAQITLIVKEQEYVIRDGLGNKLYFNLDGLLTRSVSCHNASIQKIYNYDTQKRLVSVYDSRTVTNGKAKSRIELQYGNGCLTSVTSYGNFNRKLFCLAYGYDSGNNLVSVSQVAFNKAGEQCISKPLLEFAYSNGQLSEITDTQTKQGYAITYDGTNGKVTTLSAGAVTEQTLSLGMTDSNGQALSLGQAQCGTSVSRRFVEKSCNKYSYKYIKDGDKIAYETDVTNKDGITLAYFIDRNACITSTFEKDGNNLKTLNKQGAKRTATAGSDDAQTINGSRGIIANQNPSTASRFDVGFGITGGLARNEAEKTLRHYEYSFWLKIKNAYKYPKVSATFVFSDTAQQITERVLINGSAVNAWQRVSVPVTLPVDSKGKPFNGTLQIFVSLLNNNVTVGDTFEINEIGFAPAPRTVLQFETETNGYVSLDKIKTAMVETNKGVSKIPINEECFFTESDVIASYTNRQGNDYIYEGIECFDVVCNNGTKLLTDIQYLSFCVDKEDTMDFRINTTLVNGNEINVEYNFKYNGFTVKTTGVTESGKTSSSETTVDYKGKTLSQTDEYGVTTEYSYDAYGSLTRKRVVASDGTVGAVENYAYNADGSLFSVDNGLTGQKYGYTEQGQPRVVAEQIKAANGELTETGHKTETEYGVYKDKPLNVTESIETETIGKNEVTYEQGRIRTVTDGTVKYGVKQDNVSDRVEYTQFDGDGNEQVLERNSVSGQWQDDYSEDDYYRTHKTEYLHNGRGEFTSVDVDQYNLPYVIKRGAKDNIGLKVYCNFYHNQAESRFANKPYRCYNYSDQGYTDYFYDYDGNLTGWEEYEKAGRNNETVKTFELQKIEDNAIRYKFVNHNVDYYAVLEHDQNKALSPRVTAAKNMHYGETLTGYEAEDIPIYCQQYEYNQLGQLIKTYTNDYYSYEYAYTNVGSASLLSKISYVNNSSTYPHIGSKAVDIKQNEEIAYNANGTLKSTKQTYNWSIPSYIYDRMQTSSGTVTKKYIYDSANRLKTDTVIQASGSKTDKTITNYTYRQDGRIDCITVENYNGDSLLLRRNLQRSYDNQGRLIKNGSIEYTYDGLGNRTSRTGGGKTTTYSFDYGSILQSVTKDGITSTYKYNADGTRYRKTVNGKNILYYLDGNKVLAERTIGRFFRYMYGKDGIIGFETDEDTYLYIKDSQDNVSMLMCLNNNTCLARYEYDSFGICTVYDGDGKINTDPNFIGNINPFRWKSFYFDTESNLYYANGSYYDPETGQYIDAAPISTAIDNALMTRSLDRNGLMCNNTIELAGNPYTIEPATGLSSDPTYNPTDKLPNWLKRRIERQKRLQEIYNRIPWYAKVIVGTVLLAASIALTLVSRTGGAGVASIFIQLALGIGIGVGTYLASSLLTDTFTPEGLLNTVLDTFVITTAVIFISASINYIKYLTRSRPVTTGELTNNTQYPPNNGAVPGTEEMVTLEPGVYGRYGGVNPQSRYITNHGASPEQLSLPPWNNRVYTEIHVLKPIRNVQKSIVAPWEPWGGLGGGQQYYLPKTINQLIKGGYIGLG